MVIADFFLDGFGIGKMSENHIQQNIEFRIPEGREVGEPKMPLDDSVFALADVLLLIEEGEDPGGLFNITVNIGSGLHQNVDISGQSRRLIQNQRQFQTEYWREDSLSDREESNIRWYY